MLPMSGIIYLTHNCYLNCKHCFLKQSGKLTKKKYLPYSEVINILNDFSKNKVFMVAFTGGDPLLHPNLFDILNETYSRNMLPILGVSGVNVTDEIAKKIKSSHVPCVQVSLDGSNDNVNSIFRGPGVFDQVCNSINILNKYNINVNLAICISKENFNDYKNLIKFAFDNNISKLKLVFWKDYNNCKVFTELSKSEVNEITTYCKNFQSENNLEDWILCLDENQRLIEIHKKAIIIDADGSIMKHEEGEIIGNVYDGNPSYFYKKFLNKGVN